MWGQILLPKPQLNPGEYTDCFRHTWDDYSMFRSDPYSQGPIFLFSRSNQTKKRHRVCLFVIFSSLSPVILPS